MAVLLKLTQLTIFHWIRCAVNRRYAKTACSRNLVDFDLSGFLDLPSARVRLQAFPHHAVRQTARVELKVPKPGLVQLC